MRQALPSWAVEKVFAALLMSGEGQESGNLVVTVTPRVRAKTTLPTKVKGHVQAGWCSCVYSLSRS